jgi:hypothetical protein
MPRGDLGGLEVGLARTSYPSFLEGQMKTVLTALALFALAACTGRGEDSARVGESADTSVTPRTTQDTTIVTSDTTVQTDTTRREGDVRRDTARQ